jgi:hypothetical protein
MKNQYKYNMHSRVFPCESCEISFNLYDSFKKHLTQVHLKNPNNVQYNLNVPCQLVSESMESYSDACSPEEEMECDDQMTVGEVKVKCAVCCQFN